MKKFIKAFTLVELIVAISVIAIILAIAIPQYKLYSANLQLRKEAHKFASFLKDARLTAKSQCVNVDLYDILPASNFNNNSQMIGLRGTSENAHKSSWVDVNWLSPAFAAMPPGPPSGIGENQNNFNNHIYSSQLRAASIRINYVREHTPADGIYIGSNYSINTTIAITPNAFLDPVGNFLDSISFIIWSASTPKCYYVVMNPAGTCSVSAELISMPGASGSDK